MQFGYIVLFSTAFPIAPLLMICANLINMKVTINYLSYYSKRTKAVAAKDIGAWGGIFEVLAIGSVVCNMAMIYWTGDQEATLGSDRPDL
jgi:hypothetical protein